MEDSSNTRWQEFNSIVDSNNLSLKEKGLLLIIFRYVNRKNGYADPSRTLIKQLTGITDNRTLDKIFDSLVEKKFLVRESGKGKRSKYFVKVGGEITPSVKNVPSGEITPSVGVKATPIVGVKITPQKENKKKIKENIICHSKNDKPESKYLEIYNHWNNLSKTYGIAKSIKLTTPIKKGIDSALKLEKDNGDKLTLEEIKEAINNYAELYKVQAFTYQWRLVDFLNRKQRDTGVRQILLFLSDGTTYVNCKKRVENIAGKQKYSNPSANDSGSSNLSREEIEELIL